MFHFKNNIAAGLAIFLLAVTTSVFAEDISQVPSKIVNTTPAKIVDATPTKVTEEVPVKPNPVITDISAPAGFEENAAAIKLRSGTGNPVAGKAKSELCQGCHGEGGNSQEGMFPKLAGQYNKYIVKQIHNFQAGVRVHQIMSAIAATINEVDLTDIATYFASQTKMQGDGSEGPPLGKKLFLDGDMSKMIVGCVNCHGVNGRGKTPRNSVFPVIGGQHKEYLLGQLTNFKVGARGNSPGGVMNIITQRMTDAELDAVADYASRL